MIKIAIFGVGLIGGSLALNFKGKQDFYIIGHSNNPQSVQKYLQREVVDHATTNMDEAAADADFIFLCGPVGVLPQYLEKLSQLTLKPGCIITDVGSTKLSVTKSAEKLNLQEVYFIGGHPMAGSERSGVDAASMDLFENAFYVITPDASIPEAVTGRLTDLLKHTRAQIVKLHAEMHDDIVGAISHLPHIVAVALVNQVSKYNDKNQLYRSLSAGGFRDITRIASSSPQIWRDILLNNKDVLIHLLHDWNEEIALFMKLLKQEDGKGIQEEFEKANQYRLQLPDRKKGMIASIFDIYIDIPDHPGIIGQITTLLGEHRINISNIQIIEIRTDVPGVLRLSFREEKEMERAKEILKGRYLIQE